jgi:hypothetical protein
MKYAERSNGWIRFPPQLIEIFNRLKLEGYVQLYLDENRIAGSLLLGFVGEENVKEQCEALAQMTADEMFNEALELVECIDDSDDSVFLIPKTKRAIEAAQMAFRALPEPEQHSLVRRAQFFYGGFLAAFFQMISVMVHGEKLTALVARASAGDDDAFVRAVQIDRNLIANLAPFKSRMAQAQLEGDSEFLDSLSYRVRNPLARGKIRYKNLWLCLAMLDDMGLLNELKYGELLTVLDRVGLDRWESRIDDVSYLAKRVQEYRAYQNRGQSSMQ